MTFFHIIWTLGLLITFIGIVIWACSSRRTNDFDEAANLPLEEEQFPSDLDKNVVRLRGSTHE